MKHGRLNSFDLKVVAIITMLIDHMGLVFFREYPIFRYIGRLAFPIFCFLLVEGFYHTSNIKKYLARILLFAVISEYPFDLMVNTGRDYFHSQNIFFTLFIGLTAVWGMSWCQNKCKGNLAAKTVFNILIAIGASVAAYVLKTDYSVLGVFYIIIFYLYRGNHLFIFLCLEIITIYFYGGIYANGHIISQIFAGLSVLFTCQYNGERGPKIKYFFYLFYPVHILIIVLVYYLLHGTLFVM